MARHRVPVEFDKVDRRKLTFLPSGTIAGIVCIAAWMALVPVALADPVVDGTVDTNEYDSSSSFGGGAYRIYWTVEGSDIFIAIEGDTGGWIALGLEPSRQMKDADMMIGWVTGGNQATVVDAYSTGITGPHPPDVDLGGTSDIATYAGSEKAGVTTIEYRRPLSTGDARDQVIPAAGAVSIIWAIGPSDSFNAYHLARGSGTLVIPEILIPLFLAVVALVLLAGRKSRAGLG
jgi:hypothetical protein